MVFPNLLNQEEVIRLANSIALDESITFERNQYDRQFGNQGHSNLFGYHQNTVYAQQAHLDDKRQEGASMPSPYYHHSCCCCRPRWYY